MGTGSSFGFGPERRIRRRADFLRIQSNGERASAPHFVFLVAARIADGSCPSPADAPSRLGVVATKKVGNAVVRARTKRLCRECFRTSPDFVPPGVDLVVIARPGAHELGLGGVRTEWSRARPAILKRCAAALATKSGGERDAAASSSAPGARAVPRSEPLTKR